jgi:hypothetical protein
MREESNKKSKVFACLLSVQYGICLVAPFAVFFG